MTSDQTIDAVLDELTRRTGLAFPAERMAEVHATVARVMAESSVRSGPQALTPADDPRAQDALVTALTVGESYFFREPGQLDFISHHVIADHAERTTRPMRAWSAGCATGEEAYTLAIMLQEGGVAGAQRVLGTDISADRLAHARRGRYGDWSLRGVPAAVIDRYFMRRGAGYELAPEIRSRVEFRRLNLLDPDFVVAPMDLILCRNVLIYLDRAAVRSLAARLLDALVPGGWLFLGASDPSLADMASCEVVVTGAGLAYRRPTESPPEAASAEPLRRRASPGPGGRTSAGRARPSALVPVPPPSNTGADPPAPSPAVAEETSTSAVGDALKLVWRLADEGHIAEAERACEVALHEAGPRADLLGVKALILATSGQSAVASTTARQALYLEPDLIVGHLALGEATWSEDRVAAARSFRNAVRLLDGLPATADVPGTRGETAGELAVLTRLRLQLLTGAGDE